jgi:hypothetical protein
MNELALQRLCELELGDAVDELLRYVLCDLDARRLPPPVAAAASEIARTGLWSRESRLHDSAGIIEAGRVMPR